jgi:hypothetical protein
VKKLVLLTILFLPLFAKSQTLKNSRAYVGALLQDSRFGGTVVLSCGINQYFDIGAGADITSFEKQPYATSNDKGTGIMVPVYLDLRLKIPLTVIEPFAFGQFGKPLYSQSLGKYTDITGGGETELKQNGKYFYGVGVGISSVKKRIGFFASVAYRIYAFKYTPDLDINGREVPKPDDKGTVMISAGLVF